MLEQKLFLALLGFNALLLVLDTLLWLLDGQAGRIFREANLTLTTFYYILNPVPCLLWSLYAFYLVSRNEEKTKRLLVPLLVPLFLHSIVSLLSYTQGYTFFFDENNIYHRGNFYFLTVLICYSYLVFTFFHALLNRKKIERKGFVSILLFAFPPFIGGIVQSLFFGISLVWVCMTVSVLLVFLNTQNSQLYTDYLTGLFNRRQMDNYLREKTKNVEKNKNLAGIMIDINFFKEINDLYGHDVGDQTLKYTGEILRKSLRKEDFISRYGGDEFVAFIEVGNRADLQNAVSRIKENVDNFNQQRVLPYNIDLSIGCDIFDYNSGMTIQQFINYIDILMYKEKKYKKELVTFAQPASPVGLFG
jgi:diguanylate cyclase (GGDEF)-like protein